MVILAIAAGYLALLATGVSIGRHVTLPRAPLNGAGGAINTVVRSLLGYGDRSDFLVDYASAHALTHGGNAYGITAGLLPGVGPPWHVMTANPHPPTLLTLVIPTTFLSYHVALAAWALAMIFVLIWTLYLVGVRPLYAIPVGLAIAFTIPGNYGIVNPVPIIGLGIAMAYRWRDSPVLAGLGIAVAAIPKESGLLLAVVFLLAGRIRTVAWSIVWYGLSALIPLALDAHVWSHYFRAGFRAIGANEGRSDNASLLFIGRSSGIPEIVILVILGAIVVAVAIARRDLFWPTAWAMVATLPIAWGYSQLTYVPLVAWAVVRGSRRSLVFGVLAGGLVLGVASSSAWLKPVLPLITALVLLVLLAARPDPEGQMWLPRRFDPVRSWPVLNWAEDDAPQRC